MTEMIDLTESPPPSRDVCLKQIERILDVSAVIGEDCVNTIFNQLTLKSDAEVAELAERFQSMVDAAVGALVTETCPEIASCCGTRDALEWDLGLVHD